MKVLMFMKSVSLRGGVETWLGELVPGLTASGVECLVVLMKGMQANRPELVISEHPDWKVRLADGRGLDRHGRVHILTRILLEERPDVVIPLGVVDAFESAAIAKIAGVNFFLVARTQGNLPEMVADIGLYRRWIDRVVTPGRLAGRVLVEWGGFSESSMELIPNGADLPVCRRRERNFGETLRLGFVGRMTGRDKRPQDLIPLVRELDQAQVDYTLTVVGDGPELPRLQAALGGHPRVVLKGGLSRETVYRDVYPTLDVLVLTSSSESFGIVLVEAMMNGVVPICSRYDGFHTQRLVIEGETGDSFPVGDMCAAAQCIKSLSQDEMRLQVWSANAVRSAQTYSWPRCVENWIRFLKNLSVQKPVCPAEQPPRPASPVPSRLTRVGLPDSWVFGLRLLRRRILGPSVPPGGEEWPLFRTDHPESVLAEVREVIARLEANASMKQASGMNS